MKSFFTNQGAFFRCLSGAGHPASDPPGSLFSGSLLCPWHLRLCLRRLEDLGLLEGWKKLGGVFQLELIVGVILVVIGLVALFKSEVLLSSLPVIIGLIILMDGLVTINQALNLRKLDYRWKYLLPMGIVVAVFGLVLVLNPFGSAMLLMRFLGFTLLVDGFCDFWWYYRLKKLFE